MIMALFESLLKEFKAVFPCELEPDENNSCLIVLGNGLRVQIELKRSDLLVTCQIATLPIGRYRDNLFLEALKHNETFPPSAGMFGFSGRTHTLYLFLKLDPDLVTTAKLATILPPFITIAGEWTEAIKQGKTPSVSQKATTTQSNSPMDIFSSSR
jgi:hypothetical protein